MSKLTKYNVIDIRRANAFGHDMDTIAMDYDVSKSTIKRIVNGESWQSVETPIKIENYPSYEITSDSRIYNLKSGKYMTENNGSVRLRTYWGDRERVQISELMDNHY